MAYQESGLCDISYVRYSEKTFSQIYKGFYGDAMLVFLLRGANMATGNQQKHLKFEFPTNAWIHLLKNS